MKTATVVLFCILMLAQMVCAGWQATILHPAGSTATQVSSLDANQQGGVVTFGGFNHAGYWQSGVFTDLHPSGVRDSQVNAVRDGKQVGSGLVLSANRTHAFLWNGTKGSVVDLNPVGNTNASVANTCWGNMQAGNVGGHASIWYGTAESWVDINPVGYLGSNILDTDGVEQVGNATKSVLSEAYLWSGTQTSAVCLNPVGASSIAYGVSNGKQVGMVSKDTVINAAIWSGTAKSWQSLNPVGEYRGYATCISSTYQAGYTGDFGFEHAALWQGTAESYLDLASFLPEDTYSASYARDIEVVGEDIWVGGNAYNSVLNLNEGVVWHFSPAPVPEPSSLITLLAGVPLFVTLRRKHT